MHTHAVRTTEDKLAETIDEWIGPAPAHSTAMPVVLHKGSRDYLVVIRHPEHDEGAHARHGAHGETDAPIVVGTYPTSDCDCDPSGTSREASPWTCPHGQVWEYGTDAVDPYMWTRVGGGGSYGGWIEDRARSWVLYYGHGGRPEVMWLRRDTTGGVVGEPITFSGAQVDTVPGWDLNDLRASVGKAEPHVMYAVTSAVGVHAPHRSVLIDRVLPHGRERVAELAPIGSAGDPIEPLVDFAREVVAAITFRPAEPLAEEKAAAIESYTARLSRERSHFYNETVSARETLRVLGWPDARDDTVTLHRGVTWLAEQKNPPRVMTSKQVRTREVLAVIGSEEVTAEHAVYVEIDGRTHPAADVTTCNGGHGLLIVAPPLRETYSDYEVRRHESIDGPDDEIVLTRRATSADGTTGRTEELMRIPTRESYSAEDMLQAVRRAVAVATGT